MVLYQVYNEWSSRSYFIWDSDPHRSCHHQRKKISETTSNLGHQYYPFFIPHLHLQQQLNFLHRRLLPHLQSPIPKGIPDAQPASTNMAGLFSFQKEEDHFITVENVVGGDINDSSTHYQVLKEAATVAGITIGVILQSSLSWAVSGIIFKSQKGFGFHPHPGGRQKTYGGIYPYDALPGAICPSTTPTSSIGSPDVLCTAYLSQGHFQFVLND